MIELGFKVSFVKKIWKIFCNLDKKKRGKIVLDHLFELVKEPYGSMITPFIERLYEIMVKEDDLYIYFDEFLAVCAAYCLMTHKQLVSCIKFSYVSRIPHIGSEWRWSDYKRESSRVP